MLDWESMFIARAPSLHVKQGLRKRALLKLHPSPRPDTDHCPPRAPGLRIPHIRTPTPHTPTTDIHSHSFTTILSCILAYATSQTLKETKQALRINLYFQPPEKVIPREQMRESATGIHIWYVITNSRVRAHRVPLLSLACREPSEAYNARLNGLPSARDHICLVLVPLS